MPSTTAAYRTPSMTNTRTPGIVIRASRQNFSTMIGGTIASNISSLAHLKKHDHHDLMLAGISSAFGAVFGSPLAGAFFGMEMCFIGKIDYTAYGNAVNLASRLVDGSRRVPSTHSAK